jgi:ABC-type lipoprotein release transport system permease subunit
VSESILFYLGLERGRLGERINLAYYSEEGDQLIEVSSMVMGGSLSRLAGVLEGSFIIMRLDLLMALTNTSTVNQFMIKVHEGVNASRVADELGSKYFLEFQPPIVAENMYHTWLEAEYLEWLAETGTINFLYSTIFVGLLFAIYILTSFTRRKKEFTILRSIGLGVRQLITLAILEILTFVLFALIGGVIIGIILSIWNVYQALIEIVGMVVIIPQLVVTGYTLGIILVLPISSAILGTVLVALDFTRTNLPRMLKLDVEPVRAYRAEAG